MGTRNLIPIPSSGDANGIRRAFQKLNIVLGQEATPIFNGANITTDLIVGNDLTVGGSLSLSGTLTLSALDASRIISTNASKELVSSDLVSWVADAGTGNIVVADDTAGGITLNTVQDILTTSTPTFDDLTLSTPSSIYSLSHDSFANFVANEHVDHTGVTLTAGNGLTGGGDISANRSFAFDATYSPSFAGLTISGLTGPAGLYIDADELVTTTPPTSGALGYWDRTGTVLSPATAGDELSLSGKTIWTLGGCDYYIGKKAVWDDRYYCFQTADSGCPGHFAFFNKDGDGTDSILLQIFAKGTPESITDAGVGYAELIFLVGSNNVANIRTLTGNDAAASPMPMTIYTQSNTNQVYLDTNGSVGINTNSPSSAYKIDVNGALRANTLSALTGGADIGASGTKMTVESDGDTFWTGDGTGLCYGEIYSTDSSTTITITTTGKANKVQITSFMANGVSNNTTPDHTNDHITITKAGVYLCNVSIHAISTVGGGADNYGYSVYKNNGATEFTNLHGQKDLAGGGGDEGPMTLSGLIDLNVNDTVEVWVWNNTNADDIIIDDINLSLVQVGGT